MWRGTHAPSLDRSPFTAPDSSLVVTAYDRGDEDGEVEEDEVDSVTPSTLKRVNSSAMADLSGIPGRDASGRLNSVKLTPPPPSAVGGAITARQASFSGSTPAAPAAVNPAAAAAAVKPAAAAGGGLTGRQGAFLANPIESSN